MAFEIFKAYLTGTMLQLGLDTVNKLKGFFEKLDAGQLIKALGASISHRWTDATWYGRGEFVGQVIGYIALNVLLVMATAGGSIGTLLARSAAAGSDVARAVMALVKVVDVAQNPLKLLQGAGKGLTVGEEVAAKLKQGLPREAKLAAKVEQGAEGAAKLAEDALAELPPAMFNRGSKLIHTPREQALKELLEEARKADVIIQSDAEAKRYLDLAAKRYGGKPSDYHAVTIGDVIFVRPQYADNVRVLREELIHVFQQRGGMAVTDIVAQEIEARLMMIARCHQWSMTVDEVKEMIAEVRQMRKTGKY